MGNTLARVRSALVGAFDRVPPWAQHLGVAFLGAAVLDFWHEVQTRHPLVMDLEHAGLAGIAAAVAIVGTMAATPFTQQYGVGRSSTSTSSPTPDAATDGVVGTDNGNGDVA